MRQPRTLRIVLPILLAGSLGLSVGCGDDDGDNGNKDAALPADSGLDASRPDGGGTGFDAGTIDSTVPRNDSGDAAVVLSNAQVLGILKAVNESEITAGNLAKNKPAQSAFVLEYAAQMVADHQTADMRQQMLGAPASTPSAEEATVTKLSSDTIQTLSALAPGASFDLQYAMSQAVAHDAVLTLLDAKMIPSATGAVRTELTTNVKPTVTKHRDEAVTLVRSLTDGGFSDAGASDAGRSDASVDAGVTDAGATDGGRSDAAL